MTPARPPCEGAMEARQPGTHRRGFTIRPGFLEERPPRPTDVVAPSPRLGGTHSKFLLPGVPVLSAFVTDKNLYNL
jgi:hypothetical protein